ncbi:hypothetical protein [Streptomyces canus]|uniref:hypothetical protein n=1 Tax=Streptomyces canus TaxID=58343 RepID=UPI003866823D|nr:hypothetical protein OH824_35020 [Streptomyces canus]
MLTQLKAWRIARRVTDAFPEISRETARARARRLLTQYPRLSVEYAGESLVRGERIARMYERLMKR